MSGQTGDTGGVMFMTPMQKLDTRISSGFSPQRSDSPSSASSSEPREAKTPSPCPLKAPFGSSGSAFQSSKLSPKRKPETDALEADAAALMMHLKRPKLPEAPRPQQRPVIEVTSSSFVSSSGPSYFSHGQPFQYPNPSNTMMCPHPRQFPVQDVNGSRMQCADCHMTTSIPSAIAANMPAHTPAGVTMAVPAGVPVPAVPHMMTNPMMSNPMMPFSPTPAMLPMTSWPHFAPQMAWPMGPSPAPHMYGMHGFPTPSPSYVIPAFPGPVASADAISVRSADKDITRLSSTPSADAIALSDLNQLEPSVEASVAGKFLKRMWIMVSAPKFMPNCAAALGLNNPVSTAVPVVPVVAKNRPKYLYLTMRNMRTDVLPLLDFAIYDANGLELGPLPQKKIVQSSGRVRVAVTNEIVSRMQLYSQAPEKGKPNPNAPNKHSIYGKPPKEMECDESEEVPGPLFFLVCRSRPTGESMSLPFIRIKEWFNSRKKSKGSRSGDRAAGDDDEEEEEAYSDEEGEDNTSASRSKVSSNLTTITMASISK